MTSRRAFCTGLLAIRAAQGESIRYVSVPTGPESGMPHLATSPDGTVYLSWQQPEAAGRQALCYATWRGGSWSRPHQIASGERWFVNWADCPSLAVLPSGKLLAHWLVKNGEGKYGYGIRMAAGQGNTWQEVFAAGKDLATDYAGFVSFSRDGQDMAAAYLCPPEAPPDAKTATHAGGHGGHAEHRKTLRVARFSAQGKLLSDELVDRDVCTCCPTSMASTRHGLLVAYRGHAPGEIRDILCRVHHNGQWSASQPVHADNWHINGCPTDGSCLATQGSTTVIAWYTAAQSQPRVQVAFMEGPGFAKPIRVDGGTPLGRASVLLDPQGNAIVGWLEKRGEGKADLCLRRVQSTGKCGSPITVASVQASRNTGFPKVALTDGRVLVAWREGQVRSAIVPMTLLG